MAQEQYWSGRTNFAGLGNGTDFGKLIDGMVAKESFHKRRLEKWKVGWEDKSKELRNLNTKLLNLGTVLKKMDTKGEFMGKTVSSTDSTIVSASANEDVSFGSHKVEVKQLATTDHWTSTGVGYEKQDSPITTSSATFKFSYAGKITTLNIPANTPLKQFVANINNHPDLRGKVRASSISDGSQFHLQLKGLILGEDSTIVLSNSTIPGMQTSAFVNVQAAQDALLKVDGYPPGSDTWMHRKTNAVNDAIEGMTLNLKSAKPGTPVDVTISHDQEKTKETVIEFLKAMNEVREQIKKLTQVTKGNKDQAKGSLLTGNYGVEMVSQRLKMTTSSKAIGFDSSEAGKDPFSSLMEVGITTNGNKGAASFGQLQIDANEFARKYNLHDLFDKALKERPDELAALFITDHEMSSASTDFTPGTLVKGVTEPGKHALQYSISGGKIVSASINGKAASISGWEITGKVNTAGAGLSAVVINKADGNYTGDINVKLGKIHEMIQEARNLTNPTTGTLKVIEKNYAKIIESIDKKIERENKRLTDKRRHLKNKFSRLDATLGRYDKLQGALKAQIAKLGK